jgi:epoxyqueuosine reductase
MAKRPDQCANQCRLPGAEVAFEENHQSRMQGRCQQGAQTLGRSLVRQGKNGGNIGAMHDLNSTLDAVALKDAIRQAGRKLGFAAVGFARAETAGAAAHLRAWLAAGCHGEMDYMARHAELRTNPEQLHAGTVTVISAAVDYLPPGKIADAPEQAAISRYAQGRDYHKVVRGRLQNWR